MSTVRFRTMIGLAVSAVTLALAGTAQAMTLAVGSPELTARIAVTVPVTVSCDPFSPSLTVFSQSITVRVEQAAGREIARGTGTLFSLFPSPPVVCLRRKCSRTSGYRPRRPGRSALPRRKGDRERQRFGRGRHPEPLRLGVHGAVRQTDRFGAGRAGPPALSLSRLGRRNPPVSPARREPGQRCGCGLHRKTGHTSDARATSGCGRHCAERPETTESRVPMW